VTVGLELEADGHALLKAYAAERRRVREGLAEAAVVDLRVGDLGRLRVGDALEVEARVRLGRLAPEDVAVELLLGRREDDEPDLVDATVVRLAPVGPPEDGVRRFVGRHLLEVAGPLAYGVRVRPRGDGGGASPLHEPALWA
jgi:glycogen phosphorylase